MSNGARPAELDDRFREVAFSAARWDSRALPQVAHNVGARRCGKFAGAKARWLGGVSEGHITAIERAQPYMGGKWLRILRELSNADKHRHVALIGPTSLGDVDVREDQGANPAFPDLFPVSWSVIVELHMALYEEVMEEPGVIESRRHLIETLDVLESSVSKLVDQFEPEFEGR
jgi:hypothetical protein